MAPGAGESVVSRSRHGHGLYGTPVGFSDKQMKTDSLNPNMLVPCTPSLFCHYFVTWGEHRLWNQTDLFLNSDAVTYLLCVLGQVP